MYSLDVDTSPPQTWYENIYKLEEIEGPCTLCFFEYENKKYFLFGEIHHQNNNCKNKELLDIRANKQGKLIFKGSDSKTMSVSAFLYTMFHKWKEHNKIVDFYLERPKDESIEGSMGTSHLGKIQEIFVRCINTTKNCYLNPEIFMHTIDYRQQIPNYLDIFTPKHAPFGMNLLQFIFSMVGEKDIIEKMMTLLKILYSNRTDKDILYNMIFSEDYYSNYFPAWKNDIEKSLLQIKINPYSKKLDDDISMYLFKEKPVKGGPGMAIVDIYKNTYDYIFNTSPKQRGDKIVGSKPITRFHAQIMGLVTDGRTNIVENLKMYFKTHVTADAFKQFEYNLNKILPYTDNRLQKPPDNLMKNLLNSFEKVRINNLLLMDIPMIARMFRTFNGKRNSNIVILYAGLHHINNVVDFFKDNLRLDKYNCLGEKMEYDEIISLSKERTEKVISCVKLSEESLYLLSTRQKGRGKRRSHRLSRKRN